MEEYKGVYGGECFKCQGTRVVVVAPKAKAAKEAYLAARVQLKTIGDLEVGDTVSFGGPNTITRWRKILELPTEGQYGWTIKTSKGGHSFGRGTAEDILRFPVRVYVPTDVAPYLEGL